MSWKKNELNKTCLSKTHQSVGSGGTIKSNYLNIDLLHNETDYMKGKTFIGLYFFFKENYSEIAWKKIKEAIHFEHDFLFHHSYDKKIFFQIFKEAEKILNEQKTFLSEKFGEFYIEYITKEMSSSPVSTNRILGPTLEDHLITLISIAEITTGIKSQPTCYFKRLENTLQIKVVTDHLKVIGPMYLGYVKSSAKVFFQIEPEFKYYIKKSNNGKSQFIIMVHSLDNKMANKIFSNNHTTDNESIENDCNILKKMSTNHNTLPTKSMITMDIFSAAFPYVLVLDNDMNIIKYGSFYRKIIPDIDLDIFKFQDIFIAIKPTLKNYSFKEISKFEGYAFSFIPRFKYKIKIYFKGIFLKNHINNELCLVFVGGLRALSIHELIKMGIYLSDYQFYDENKNFIFKYDIYKKALKVNAIQEENYIELYKIIGQINIEKNIRDSLLYNVIPPKVAELLKQDKTIEPTLLKNAFVMFTGIYNFKIMCEYLQPIDLAKLVNDLFLLFDLIVKEHSSVVKIENASDKYLIASGLDPELANNVIDMVYCAFEMFDAAKLITINDIPLVLTCGIHTGDIVAGVIGKKLPRYCIFGSTVNIASRTETTSIPGMINITEDVYKILSTKPCPSNLYVKKRGTIKMKGINNPIATYIISKNRNDINNERNSSKIDAILHQCSFTHKSSSNYYESMLYVKTPIPRKITNIFGLKHQFTIEQMEEYVKKCLKRAKNL